MPQARLIFVALRSIGIAGTCVCGITAVATLLRDGPTHMIATGFLTIASLALWITAQRKLRAIPD